MEIKKLVVKLDIHNAKQKQKAMCSVCSLRGIDMVSVDMNEKKMTVTGDVDPVAVVRKLRRNWNTGIISVAPPPRPSPSPPPSAPPPHPPPQLLVPYPRYYVGSVEENPNSCVIC